MNATCRSSRVLALALLLCVAPTALSAPEEPAKATRPPLKDPSMLLLGDAAVHTELGLSTEERSALEAILNEYNATLLALRDTSATGAPESLGPKIAELRTKLKQALTAPQQERLSGLVLQAQGYDALTRDDVAKKLGLKPEQRTRLAGIMEDFWNASQELAKKPEQAPEDLAKAQAELQADRHRRVTTELNAKQTKAWAEMLGAPFDFKTVRPSPARAPELVDVDEWVNSPPLTMESLRGQVVVVHFFAFGCINCIHNYPWYIQWQDELDGHGVKIIGIHTPETKTEADNEELKKSMAKRGLKFAVAVDKAKKNWEAWSNTIWPSVYVIDKQGRLRYWWYGELDWQGAGGQNITRQHIAELLAEPAP